MEGRKLQDRLYLASGKAARYAGLLAEAYRSTTSSDPLNPQNRFIKLPAVFLPPSGSINNTNTYGQPIWHGLFDGSYTRPGDYIVVGSSTYFIASQEPLMPILCVRTNRTISISRPNQQTLTAANSYGGYTLGASVIQISNFPACVLGENRSGASTTDLPSDQTVPFLVRSSASPYTGYTVAGRSDKRRFEPNCCYSWG